ncbi:hypothetical protein BKA62DRAFT_755261 [Auriculariales sp. MPI-PUGE-AT-0066]|nr:hypothetical protein BKA62DRAFT_755261 [Auriculariales sp. MPI-PUGE-AT-0066]
MTEASAGILRTITTRRGRQAAGHLADLRATITVFSLRLIGEEGPTGAASDLMMSVIVDLGETCIAPFNAYVVLSRGKGRHAIRILRLPDYDLLTTHPCEHLRKEDTRVEKLNKSTRKLY